MNKAGEAGKFREERAARKKHTKARQVSRGANREEENCGRRIRDFLITDAAAVVVRLQGVSMTGVSMTFICS